MFQIRIFDPLLGTENAADGTVNLRLTDAGNTVRGPYVAILKPATAGTYRIVVFMDPTWPEGEYIGEWDYVLTSNVYKPRFTFHVHKVELV